LNNCDIGQNMTTLITLLHDCLNMCLDAPHTLIEIEEIKKYFTQKL